MLIRDLINIPKEAIPVISPSFSTDKALNMASSFIYDSLPVLDPKSIYLGMVKKSALVSENGSSIKEYMLDHEGRLFEDEDAIKVKELFTAANNDVVFVIDRKGILLGGVSGSNPAIRNLEAIHRFLPTPEIFDAMHEAIIIIDADATIVYANHSYHELIGVPLWKIIGKKMYNVEPTSRCLGVLRGDSPLVNERIKIQSIDLEVIATITPICEGNKKVGVISVFRSIDETLQLSQKIRQMEHMNRYLKNELELKAKLPTAFDAIIGKNGRFVEALALAARVSRSNANVLIRGETGTGKEVLANAIHNASDRSSKPMIRVNCAAIPEPLLESELFGYEEGAFSGAQKGGRIGKFELAHSGTIFLDEVGDMSLSMQAKILRVIQEKQFERVGGNKVINVDVRIISATNRDLEDMVREGIFREDLYYRLNVVSVMLPPLRERKEDIPLLAEHFVERIADNRTIQFTQEVMDIFMDYDWKGNIRQLQNVIEHAVALCRGDLVHAEDLPKYLQSINNSLQQRPRINKANLSELMEDIEKDAIIAALRQNDNNKSAAMRSLGISRRTFYKKLKQYGIG